MASPAAGTSPLADILAAEGWHLDASAIANAARASKGDVDAARARLANADLCAVGVGCLPASVAAKGVRGPAVLQVVDARDISRPARGGGGRDEIEGGRTDGGGGGRGRGGRG